MPNLNQFNISPSVKLAITVHDLSPVVTKEFYDFKRNLWHRLLGFKRAFERANVLFAVSEYTKLDLMRLFKVPEQKIRVVYPGIDHKIFNPNISDAKLRSARNIYGLPGEYILFLNTIEPRKNLSGLLKAYERLKSNINLVIAGRKGWKYKNIFREIKNSKKSAKIRYVGYVEEQDKPAIIRLSKMLVYPSFYEGFGFQPLEAMAVGVPTIVSQVTALPEVVSDSSLPINPYSIDDIREGMDILLLDQNLRQRLIAKGLERVKKYDWQRTAEQVLEGLSKI
jgi:glycosyltransferase involved in cell wall biosynthesis